jgi:hypothetical protein
VKGSGGDGDYQPNAAGTTRSEVGLPLARFTDTLWMEYFKIKMSLTLIHIYQVLEVGDLRFVDTNGDGILNGDDRTYTDLRFQAALWSYASQLLIKDSLSLQISRGNKAIKF